jgi:flagellar biosynthetic protein FliP
VISRARHVLVLAVVLVAVLWPSWASAAPDGLGEAADVGSWIDQGTGGGGEATTALRVLLVMTALSLIPAVVLTMTSFTRIIIVFTFLRQALGIQNMPPNQVLTGMALFLTAFIMAPVAAQIHEEAIAPLTADQITATQALERGSKPLAEFMLAHVDDEDLRLFYDISDRPRPATRADVDFVVLVPAFILGEVRTAFEMGFLVLIPFMVIDLVVSSILMAMGMVMLPPALIALPVKVMVFVLVDGWGLVIASLVRSFT